MWQRLRPSWLDEIQSSGTSNSSLKQKFLAANSLRRHVRRTFHRNLRAVDWIRRRRRLLSASILNRKDQSRLRRCAWECPRCRMELTSSKSRRHLPSDKFPHLNTNRPKGSLPLYRNKLSRGFSDQSRANQRLSYLGRAKLSAISARRRCFATRRHQLNPPR